jgi:gliding motility-associated-like protein
VNIVSCGSSLHNTNCDVDIASAFSPNGDGINDFISPVTSKNCVLNDYEFIIFDRGGQIIFQTRSLNQKWDGRYKHRNCPFATYYYLLKYKLHNQQNINRKSGYIQLLR